jgi:HK97 family phage prohead protease
MTMTETRNYFELKEVNEDGSFVGIASVYGVEDLGGDVVDKGAFKKTISENPSVPILWQHKADEVIGTGTVKEWQGKVLLEAKLDLDDATALKAYQKMKKGLIKGLSIGFNTVKSTWEEIEGRMIRHITELKLWEVSVVTFPMLPAAQVTRVKSAEEEALTLRVKELEEKFLALMAAKSTPVEPEPAKASEPPSEGNEPDALHSSLSAALDDWKQRISAL